MMRGYTGHEHIDELGLIHMNGRVYDTLSGRFLSADPNLQAPYDTLRGGISATNPFEQGTNNYAAGGSWRP